MSEQQYYSLKIKQDAYPYNEGKRNCLCALLNIVWIAVAKELDKKAIMNEQARVMPF